MFNTIEDLAINVLLAIIILSFSLLMGCLTKALYERGSFDAHKDFYMNQLKYEYVNHPDGTRTLEKIQKR